MTETEALMRAIQRLRDAGVPDPARDARRLMAEAIENVIPGHGDPLPKGVAKRFETMISARENRHPVSHILGYRLFWGRKFFVDPEVLDPRPETETLIEHALQEPFSRVLDLGTGSGCILLTLLAENPSATGLGVDISENAIHIAQMNPLLLDLSTQAEFAVSDWYDAVPGQFDLIVSNPPYIALDEMDEVSPEVLKEPREALTDEADGLTAYRAIIPQAPNYLRPGGRILLEIGPTQVAAVCDLIKLAGLIDITVTPDLDGRDRVVSAKRPPRA